MVDYTKWDKLAKSLPDVEDNSKPSVQVTRIDPGTNVIINGKDSHRVDIVSSHPPVPVKNDSQVTSDSLNYSKWDKICASVSSESEDDKEYYEDEWRQAEIDRERQEVESFTQRTKEDEARNVSQQKSSTDGESISTTQVQAIAKPLPKVGTSSVSKFTLNGLDHDSFLWMQDGNTVSISVRVPIGTKAKQVQVSLDDGFLVIKKDQQEYFNKQLAYPVWGTKYSAGADTPQRLLVSEEDKLSHEMEWEIQDFDSSNRVIVVELHKRPLSELVQQWWDKAFTDDSVTLDLQKLSKGGRSTNGEKMQKVWDEAHKEFRKRVAQLKPTVLDLKNEEE